MDLFALKTLTFIGIALINTCVASGLTAAVMGRPGVGLALVLVGGAAGGALIFLEQKKGVVAPWQRPEAPAQPQGPRPTVPAHLEGGLPLEPAPAANRATAPLAAAPGPTQAVPGPTQAVPGPTQGMPGPTSDGRRPSFRPTDEQLAPRADDGRPREKLQDEATVAELTMSQNFTPDYSARAVKGLGEIYQEMQKPGVNGYLLVIAGPDRDRAMPVETIPITIGRGSFNKFQLHDNGVSTEQATILFQEGHVYLTDNKSKNGTFVNNERVVSQKLENCDILAFGSTKILVTLPS